MSTSTSGCWALKFLLARATASGQPFCASFCSQTTSLPAWAFEVPPLAVVAAMASMAARTAATRNRTFMSPPGAWGATLASPIGLDHQPRAGDWHRPISVSIGLTRPFLPKVVLTMAGLLCFHGGRMSNRDLTRQSILELIEPLQVGEA